MSKTERKIGHYGLFFYDIKEFKLDPDAEHEHIIDERKLDDLFNSILSLEQADRTYNVRRSNKIYYLDNFSRDNESQEYLGCGYFVSGKYNHSPDLISIEGGRRPSGKRNNEAEEERTHFAVLKTSEEFYVLLEERKVGVSMNTLVNYLNQYHRKWCKMNKSKRAFSLSHYIIPSESFVEALLKVQKIHFGTVFTNKERIGSEFLHLAEQDVERIRDDVEITIKSNFKDSLPQRIFKKLHKQKLEGKYKRIRINCTLANGNPVTIDTDKAKLVKYVIADLNPNGTVNSESIFTAFKSILLDTDINSDQEE